MSTLKNFIFLFIGGSLCFMGYTFFVSNLNIFQRIIGFLLLTIFVFIFVKITRYEYRSSNFVKNVQTFVSGKKHFWNYCECHKNEISETAKLLFVSSIVIGIFDLFLSLYISINYDIIDGLFFFFLCMLIVMIFGVSAEYVRRSDQKYAHLKDENQKLLKRKAIIKVIHINPVQAGPNFGRYFSIHNKRNEKDYGPN